MSEKDLKKLGRAELVEILCRQRELIDELTEKNRGLTRRAEEAEGRCLRLESICQETEVQREADQALRAEMRQVLEKIDSMSSTIRHCGEAERRIQEAQRQADDLLAQARSEADRLLEEAEREIDRRKDAFSKQCDELVRGQEILRRLMENR